MWTFIGQPRARCQLGRIRSASFFVVIALLTGVLDSADSVNAGCVNTYHAVRDQCDPTAWLCGK